VSVEIVLAKLRQCGPWPPPH